jgi:hypothetical protein
VHRAHHCHDVDGSMLALDSIRGEDKRTVPSDYRSAAYQELLLVANSAKNDGRHTVLLDRRPDGNSLCQHVIDIDMSNVVGGTRNRESIVMIRNVTKIDAHSDHLELQQQLTLGCDQLRVSEA